MPRRRRTAVKRNANKKNDEVTILPYNLEAEVDRLWLKAISSPDQVVSSSSPPNNKYPLGVQEMLDCLIVEHPDCPAPIKRQVKAAKNAVPYRRLPSNNKQDDANTNDNTTQDFDRFVHQMIEQRSNFRGVKRWDEVNELTERLQAMGIELDDGWKTWKVGTPTVVDGDNEDDDKDATSPIMYGMPCQMCGRMFGSRNLVFQHLRDPTSTCGNSILGSGESLGEPPSAFKHTHNNDDDPSHNNDNKNKKNSGHRTTPKTGATVRHAPPEACVWMGGLPLEWTKPSAGQYKHLKAFLFRYSPRGVFPPWIKTVIRKAYRFKSSSPPNATVLVDTDERKESLENDPTDRNGDVVKRAYMGFAILVYRDAEEAKVAISKMDGMKILTQTVYPMGSQIQSSQKITDDRLPNFVVTLRPATTWNGNDNGRINGPETGMLGCHDSAGLDPPLLHQLQPLPMDELQRRYLRLTTTDGPDPSNKEELLAQWLEVPTDEDRRELVAQAYTINYHPRRQVRYQGKIIPEELQLRILDILQGLRWPAQNHRSGLSAERYLVLTTSSETSSSFFEELRHACRDLMTWADPDYHYSGIAVTKNFVASPHLDDRDQSFQYAVSLGDFTRGGELCVEGRIQDAETSGQQQQPPDFVNVVKTHNRMARVDGRNVHWVRTWQGGDRYSLIFYDTSDRHPTPILKGGVDLSYLK